MREIIEGVGVDAGIIMICDEDYFDEYGKKFDPRLSKVVNLSPGDYHVEWEIKKTWKGPIKGKGTVKISSGRMIVSDPCYCIEDWDRWLDETEYGKFPGDGVILIDKMGGDGVYSVILNIENKD